MGNFSVIVPIYLGAIFVFFIYIVAKIMMKKFDDKEEEEEVDPKDAYKDDGWWSKITERINKVGECVKKGTDLEIDEEDEKKANNTKKSENSGEFDVLKHRLDRTEESLNNLGKNIHDPINIDILHITVGQMDQLAGLVTSQSQLITQVLVQLQSNNMQGGAAAPGS